MTGFTTWIIETALLPPFNLILLGAAGLALLKFRRRLGWGFIAASLVLLYGASTPLVSGALVASLQTVPAIEEEALTGGADAIVVLGAGVHRDAPEYGGDSLDGGALERLRYGARLHWLTGKPILVTGGSPQGTGRTEASLMKEVLELEFGAPVRWVEERSNNTYENAHFSYEILSAEGIERIYLVTHAFHMWRAKRAFERTGFKVTPAPTRFAAEFKFSVLDLFPRAGALSGTSSALREWLGRLWYEVSD